MKHLRKRYETPYAEEIDLCVEQPCCGSDPYDSSTLPDFEVDPFDFGDFLF